MDAKITLLFKDFNSQKKKLLKSSPKARSKSNSYDCERCALYKEPYIIHGKLEPYGKNRKKVMIIGEGPGAEENRQGIPFCGAVGNAFMPYFSKYGINFERDCVVLNAVDCRPATSNGSANRPPTLTEIRCCYQRKEAAFKKYKPRVILLVGDKAIDSFYECDPYRKQGLSTEAGLLPLSSFRGKVIPDLKLNAWICHIYHPSYLVRGKQDQEHIFDLDFAVFAHMIDQPRPKFNLYENNIEIFYKFEDVKDLLDDIWCDPFAFDYESSSFRYHEGIHTIHMISVAFSHKKAFVFPYDMNKPNGEPWWNSYQFKKITQWWKKIMIGIVPKRAHNIKHEHKATKEVFGVDVQNWEWDSMIASHVLDESQKTKGLKIQTYLKWGFNYGGEIKPFLIAGLNQRNKFEEVPIETSGVYCGRDSMFCNRLTKWQQRMIKKEKLTNAYELLHKGSIAFANMEREGICFDVDRALKWQTQWERKSIQLKEEILGSPEIAKFTKQVGRAPKYDKQFSGKDLQRLLFNVLKEEPLRETKTGFSVDESVLIALANRYPFIQKELEFRKLTKMRGYLDMFLRLQVNGFLYPSFNLHITRSYRSSSNDPNFQNVPHYGPGAILRKLFIPRPGHVLLTADYGAMEMRIIACVTQDKAMLQYLLEGGDPHGDLAREVFSFLPETWFKAKAKFKVLRQSAKNKMTFPEVYGSYWKSIADNFWEDDTIKDALELFEPKLTPRRRFEKFQGHIEKCEQWFWDKFHESREWQRQYMLEYQKTGYVRDLAWGFKRRGYLERNKLFNFPAQGPAFHCLLWSLTEIMEKYRPHWSDSMLCGQIHDDAYLDANKTERDDVMEQVTDVMTKQVRKEHPWIIVPLLAEWKEGSKNWYEMKEIVTDILE